MAITCVYDMLEDIIKKIGLGKTVNEISYEYNNITYDFEVIHKKEVKDNVLDNVSSDQSKFLVLFADKIRLDNNVVLTPKYPKKSLIIISKDISGGTISMTAKGPNVLPQDIQLTNKILIPAYANNRKVVSGMTGRRYQTPSYVTNRKGNDGTGYNCGSGGIGGTANNNWNYDRMNNTGYSGSGYSYGGGAGSGGFSGEGTLTSEVNQTYPMRGANGLISYYYVGCGGVGNPTGSHAYGSYSDGAPSSTPQGVGGRLIIFCKTIKNINLESRGSWYNDTTNGHRGHGGSSGGGSINIFYSVNNQDITTNVTSRKSNHPRDLNECAGQEVKTGGAGGNGTVTLERYSDTLFNQNRVTRYYTMNSNIFKDSEYSGLLDYTDLIDGVNL